VAPVNETDMVLLPEGLQALKKVAKEVGLEYHLKNPGLKAHALAGCHAGGKLA